MTTAPLGMDDDAERRSDGRLVRRDAVEVVHYPDPKFLREYVELSSRINLMPFYQS